jgi:hypothetical protein
VETDGMTTREPFRLCGGVVAFALCLYRFACVVGSPLFSYSGGSSETVSTAGCCLRVSRR